MRAVVYEEFCGPLRMTHVPDPTPTDDGVVIQVMATGVCRSDWHGWQGHDRDIRKLPHVPGHELAGTVVATGRSVTRWRPGDRVTIPFVAGCGACRECRRGAPQVCPNQYQPGFSGWGSFAEAVAVRYADFNLVRIPEDLTFVGAASFGCRIATAYRAVVEQGGARAGDWVAVFGCGGLGLSAVMIGAAVGGRVIAVDIRPSALSLARELGAEATIDAGSVENTAESINELTQGGADLTLDALGSRVTALQAINSLRRQGRHVQVGLLVGPDAETAFPMGKVIGQELEIVGCHGLAATSYANLWRWASEGKIAPQRLVTSCIGLGEAGAALEAMGQFSGMGVTIIEPQRAGDADAKDEVGRI